MFKVLSLFSGIGAFEKALSNLGVDYELVNYCEIDKYASQSYAAIHNVDESLNLGDITTVDTSKLPNDIDLLTHGSPCQSFSLAGLQHGGDKGSGTRSSLMWETVRIIGDIKPKVVIWENVKNVLSQKHRHNFDAYVEQLNELNYNSYHKILNSRDYGIPQNRERIFVVSIRKDIDNGKFKFPEGFELKLRLKDMLEKDVDEKYYIDNPRVEKILNSNFNQEKERIQKGDICSTLLARDYKDPKCVPVRIGGLYDTDTSRHQAGSVWDTEQISPTIDTMQGGNRQPCVVINNDTSTKPSIQRIDIPQTVKVRKYEVDTDKLCSVLREAKDRAFETAYGISEVLDVSQTKVAHWFRQDDSFAIPDADIWMELKELLKIETDEFDEAIMTFEEKEGVYDKSERHYLTDGIAPTLLSSTVNNEKFIVETNSNE